jgi:acyl carrier protein
MQKNEKVLQHILDILRPYAPDGLDINRHTELVADMGLDSLKVMRILENLEDDFDISIPINIIPGVHTVEDLVMEINKLRGN